MEKRTPTEDLTEASGEVRGKTPTYSVRRYISKTSNHHISAL